MKLLVIGCGSIGERHIRNLRSLSVDNILACDTNSDRLHLMKEKYDAEIYKDVDEALKNKPDAVLICTPPNLHIPMALKSIEHNAHIFIEKPISHNLEKVDDFLTESKRKKLIVLVGYNLRFHQGIILMKKMINEKVIGRVLSARAEVGQYLPDWRPWQDYRQSYTGKNDMGGGIILDGSHEIDYIRWLLGDIAEVSCFADKVSDLDVDVEDIAEILLKFKNKIIAEIHLDFVQREYSRNCKIIGEEGTLIWDYPGKYIKTYRSTTKQWKTYPIEMEPNDMYVEEMKHFIHIIKTDGKSLIDGYEGKTTLSLALAAKESATSHKVITL
jgi:predicted dehydrogenase